MVEGQDPRLRQLLEAERLASVARIQMLEDDLEALAGDAVDANADDEHDSEGSTLAYERARVGALLAGARANLDELHRAMARLAAGQYAVCELCGGHISPERLEALPAVRTCLECAVGNRPST